ncbi:MAG: aspartyl protease family protein [Sphingomonas sp.]|uniref:aspartyl protease family protein n=1 Tax=Sphingomonas sp. TaxID=28214 RepID=UPI001ACCACCA|nr:aspartyl protease family protein [Sphingomonas sp.]MBN8815496.1 aspartyl protease family protein [Sphingomonas sp.]
MHRWLLPLAILLPAPLAAAMTPGLPAPMADHSVLAPDAEAQWVPFDLTPGNQIRFRMTIDGRAANALLDTGFNQTVISRRWANAARLSIAPRGTATAIGGAVAMGAVDGRTLTIGGLTKTGGWLGVLDLPDSATGGSDAIDAVIGGDLLRHYALDIDFAQRRFRLLPSGRLPFAGQSAPLSIAERTGLYISETRIDGARLRPMIVDTGDGATLAVSAEAWAAIGARRTPTTTTVSYSVAGPVQSDFTVLPEIAVGDATLRQAETTIEANGGFSARMGASGRIGAGFLQRFRVLLDPLAGRMVLAANADTDRAPLRSTSGLLVRTEQDRLRVLHVMRGSPAAAGGWQPGEEICGIDGISVSAGYRSDPIAMWPAGNPGRVVRLRLCGGSTRALTLARFY